MCLINIIKLGSLEKYHLKNFTRKNLKKSLFRKVHYYTIIIRKPNWDREWPDIQFYL